MKVQAMIFYILLFFSCQKSQQLENNILASKNGLHLTEKHFQAYIAMLTFGTEQSLSTEDIQIHKTMLLEDFYENPIETVNNMEEHIKTNESLFTKLNEKKRDKSTMQIHTTKDGFVKIQQLLDPKGEYTDAFNEPQALQFRKYLKGYALHREDSFSGSADFGGGYTYQETLYYCSNGTFAWNSVSGVAVSYGVNQEKKQYTGYWTTFVQQGKLILALYSEHPDVLQVNPKGFLPQLVKSYDFDVVRIASDESQDYLYRRIKNTVCQ